MLDFVISFTMLETDLLPDDFFVSSSFSLDCTIPHKVEVIKYLDGLGSSAELMGAVNCVVNREGQLIGENTDGKGFVSCLKKISDLENKSCIIFGAGGAARAISVEMALSGCSNITIVNRSRNRAEELIDILKMAK